MSTPVFEEKKCKAEVDLSVRMQHMIDLQNDQQRLSHNEDDNNGKFVPTGSRRGEPPESTVPTSGADAGTSLKSKTLSRSVRLSSLHDISQAQEPTGVDQLAYSDGTGRPQLQEKTSELDNFPVQEQGVGRGTLYFNTEKLGSAASAATQSVRSDDSSRPVSTEDRQLLSMANNQMESQSLGYGSLVPSRTPLPPNSLPENPHYSPNHQGPAYPMSSGYHQVGSQHEPVPNASTAYRYPQQQRSTFDSILRALQMGCSCLWHLLCCIFCCCSSDVEQLQRSFCYGAIDGMLTGSGIVAAFCGMDILAPTSTITIRTFVVAFSAAACFADSLCMALGHVWTTHVLVSTQARERTATRASVDQNKADAKGKLVDMLLERGMLKIDAMSLADTLEGYPDLFVSALVGDALIAGGVGGSTGSSTDLSVRQRSASGGSPSASRGWSGHHWNGGEDYAQHMAEQESGGFTLWKFPSYGQHINDLDQEIDPENAIVGAAMAESRREAFFMMLGFSVFAVVPSLLYLVCPMLVTTQPHHKTSDLNSDAELDGGSTSATSIVISTAAVFMWCLGVWKSRFLDSNWMLFGIETVVVMLVCITAAYGVGSLLRACFPDLNALTSSASTIDISGTA